MPVSGRTLLIPLGLTAVGALAAACGDDETTTDTNAVTTSVTVQPSEFLGTLPCGDIEGAARSYTARVFDLDAEEGTDPTIGQSGRVSCANPLAFTSVIVGHRYAAEIEIFDVPVGVDAELPTWSTLCADDGFGAAFATALQEITIRGCRPLERLDEPAAPGISIDATATAGSLRCADDPEGGLVGTIEIIPIEPEDTTLPQVTRSCGQDPVVLKGDDVTDGTHYVFRIEATDIAFEQRWAALCSATARDGLTVPASCSPLTSQGAVVFPIAALAEDAGVTCGEDITRARVSLLAGPDKLDPKSVSCSGDLSFDVKEGSYAGRVELLDGDAIVAAFSCTAVVDPVATTPLECVPED